MKGGSMLKVGQKLWYVPTRKGYKPSEVEVKKIGRKWVYVGESWQNLRIDINTLAADGRGYSSPGTCYVDKIAYEKKRLADSAWDTLFRERRYGRRPADVTAEDIQKAMELLKITVEP